MSAASLAGCKLMVATPVYEGAQGSYVRAAIELAMAAPARGLDVRFEFLIFQPSIERARSLLADLFLQSDCTHLLFIDADVDFAVGDIVAMVEAMVTREDCALLGAAVPRRSVHWAQVARAVERGLAKERPGDLANFAAEFALDFADANARFSLREPVELERIGTGLLMIRRAVFERLRERHPDLAFRASAAERASYRVGERVHAYFMPMIDPDSEVMLSDDYAFCRRARDAGFRIWLAPWVRTTHSGPTIFQGSLSDLAPLFSSLSASSPE